MLLVGSAVIDTPNDNYWQAEEFTGDRGIVAVNGSRTPLMSINLDRAGTEKFCMDVALEVPELFELYEAEKKVFLEETKLLAAVGAKSAPRRKSTDQKAIMDALEEVGAITIAPRKVTTWTKGEGQE